MHNALQQIRLALRSLRRSPAFTFTVLLTLALGVGLNTAIFTVVDSVLIRPLGYHEADRIVALGTHFTRKDYFLPSLGGEDYVDLAREVHSLQSTAYYSNYTDGIALEGKAMYVPVTSASARFGEVMGVQPQAGRLFSGAAQGHEALISDALARDTFGSAAQALGHTVRFEGSLQTIVGVLPAGFSFPGKTAMWFQAPEHPENGNRTAYNQQAVGRLRPGATQAQLAAELAVLSSRLAAANPGDQDKTLEAEPLQQEIVGRVRPLLQLLMGSVLVVLLIVCVNITHLQMVRATRQTHAISVRTALGASRARLAMRNLLEAALLAVAGCAGAVLLAVPVLSLLARFAPQSLPRVTEIRLNVPVLLFSALLSLVVMCLTALLPVWRSWKVDPASSLRQDVSRGSDSRHTLRLRNSFLVVQVALTLVLLLAATLLVRQLLQQGRVDLGFAPDHLLILDAHAVESTPPLEAPSNATPAQLTVLKAQFAASMQAREARQRNVLETIAAVPGVVSVSAVSGAPMGFGGPDVSYAVRGKQIFGPPFHDLPIAEIRPISPDYLRTMHMKLVRGRNLTAQDRLGSPWVVLIDEATARQSFAGEDPIGKQIVCGLSDNVDSWMTVVGVVGSIRLSSPGEAPTPMMYVPFAQYPNFTNDAQLMIRTSSDPAVALHTITERLKQTHPELAFKSSTMREDIAATQQTTRFRNLLFCSFAAVSLLLAIVGIYGVTSYNVAQRSFEFGLRFALGADRLQVLSLVLRQALRLAAFGVAIGVVLSFALGRLLAGVVGDLPLFDAPAYLSVSAGLLALAALAALLPAQRAAVADPMRMLRTE